MKHKLSAKLISVLLAVIMIVSIVPVGMVQASAAGSNEQQIFDFCKSSMGLNNAAACGVLANIKAESSFNPTASCIDTNGKTSYGICQWNGGRFTNLKNYCSRNGLNYTLLTAQLNYLKYELQNSYSGVLNSLRGVQNSADGAEAAALTWAAKFEVCATKYRASRGTAARNTYWPKYKVSTGGGGGTNNVTILDPNRFVFPVLGSCRVSSPYGSRSGSYHYGIDIATSGQNNTVVSTKAGTVVSVSNNCSHVSIYPKKCAEYNTYGNMIVIRNNDGTYAYYGHLQKNSMTVRNGDSVLSGQKIANVGSSGYSSGEHLHFEIRNKYNAGRSTSINRNVNTGVMNYLYISSPVVYNAVPPVPATPNLSYISANDIAKGRTVSISWNAVSYATQYVVAIRGAESRDVSVGNATSMNCVLTEAGTYSFYVKAVNGTGCSAWSSARNCTAHNPVTVQFVDWDDSALTQSVQIPWGDNAKAPDSPYRKGYTFQGWSDSYYNVKTDKVIKATYKINTYIINFFDREGVLIDSQKVTYGSDATPPTDTHATGRYEFKGWSSTDYIDVYTDRADKNINIDGIYAWDNYDLPVECTVKSAERQYDGYTVVLDIENNDSIPVTGRAVVALKTAEGKLVDMTESTAFSIKAGKTKSDLEVFLPCTNPATQAEVFMVANYSSGVPISSSDTKEITKGVMYAESTVKPDNEEGTLDIQEVTQYRYRDKEKTTGNSKTLDGWTWDETRNTTNSGWSAWSWNSVSKTYNSDGLITRDVKTQQAVRSYNTKTQYRYSHWTNGSVANGQASMSNASLHYSSWSDYAKMGRGSNSYGYTKYGDSSSVWGYCGSCGRSYFPWYNQETQQVNTSANYATQYSYINYTYTYNFYRWKPWSDWNDTEVTSTGNRDVQTRTIYRYQSNVEVPEDNSGVERQYSGNLGAENAGKQVTLYVYGYTGASDYTNQYIGQTTVESDGHYSFTYKLREEPTMKTGDFTVAIGVEGSSDIKVVDTIEAPKPVYTVNFYDWDGTIISSQQVEKGNNATPPTNPTKEGFKFLGWDKSVTNITEDTDIFADFEREEYTVVFVDWQNQTIKMEKFNYGDVLVPPEAEEVEGYDFIGWDVIEEGKQYVTEDIIVTAVYQPKEYIVKFVDADNQELDVQSVNYGECALVPDNVELGSNIIFAGWYEPEKYQIVKNDVTIYPVYLFEETTEIPVANFESGEYTDNLKLTLTTPDENAVIYYYLNGDESTEQIYTKPISISKTCSVTYHAESLGKNNSEEAIKYYCINNSDKPSEWMLYNDLPEEVKNSPTDFTVEQETGYSFKDVETTSSTARASELMDDDWTLAGVTYTDYTPWQDEVIEQDTSKIGFEVETGEAPDTTKVRYRYSHFKYTDNGVVKFAPRAVEGFDCEEEFIYSDNRLSIIDFLDDGTSYYETDGQTWFNQSKVNGVKPQYRSRYKVAEYYKWTDWSVEIPSASETREQKSDDVFRYYNKNYHLVRVLTPFIDNELVFLVEHTKNFNPVELAVHGYDLKGMYSDAELTNQIGLSTPITESMTLYANFTPKQYTVTFQMQDGTELDTQTVDYMTAATAPDTDSVPGWVFAGWDKDFSSITEDTVVTGRYVRESEYARISLPRSTYNMYTSTKISLEPTITPEHLSESKVEWTSGDPSIATVDDKGNVTALGAGETTITATVVSSGEKAECKVIVKADLATTILLKSNSKLNYDDLGFLRRIKYRTDVQTVANEFENTDLSFFNVEGTKLAGTDFVGTGAQVKLFDGDNVIDSKTVVVTGDLNGDGIINNRDVAMMNRKVAELITLEDYQAMAFDANGDGAVNNKDVALIARFLVGKEAL